MKSTFFSYSGRDKDFVGQVTPKFRPDLVYDYDVTAGQGENFKKETGEEGLSRTKLFVVFWSENYWKSESCMQELVTAGKLFKIGVIHHALILRIDGTPIDSRNTVDPKLQKSINELNVFTSSLRASNPNVEIERAIDLIYQKQMLISTQIQVPECRRDDLSAAFRKAIERNSYTFRPAMWLSGYNGNGRTALVKDFCRYLDSDAPVHEIDVNECSLPGLLVLKIEAQIFGTSEDTLRALAADSANDSIEAAVLAVERVRDAGGFLTLRQVRVQEERVELPDWIFNLVEQLRISNRPALFIVSQLAPKSELLANITSKLGSFKVPSLTQTEALAYCKSIIRARGVEENRVSEDLVERISYSCAGCIELLVKMTDAVIGSDVDPNDFDLLLRAQHEQFSDSLTGYISWCVEQLAGNEPAFLILLALNNISPCSTEALRRLVGDDDFDIASFQQVRRLGLVELYGEELFRLSPLLSARLTRDLLTPERVEWMRSAFCRFATTRVEVADIDDPVDITLIEGQVKSSLLAGLDPTPEHLNGFVSISHLFEAGILLYARRQYSEAFGLFKRCSLQIDKFSDNTKSEVYRYLGMTSVRTSDGKMASICITKLRAKISSAPVADFVEAFRAEVIERNFPRAATLYHLAWKDAHEKSQKSREARAIRSYISVALKTPDPDYGDLAGYAERAVAISRTHWNLTSRARVYLRYVFVIVEQQERAGIRDKYIAAMNQLKAHPGGLSGWHEVYAEKLATEGIFEDAAEEMAEAIIHLGSERRIEFWQRRWNYLLKTKNKSSAQEVIDEIETLRSDPDWKAAFIIERRETKDFYKLAMNVTGNFSAFKLQQLFPA